MKRCWIGAGLLLLLLALSLGLGWGMQAVHAPVEENLRLAAAETNWEQAKATAVQADLGWKKWSYFRLCLADHTPVEEIDARFARLRNVMERENREEFSALAAETAQLVKAMGESHALNLWNFL